MTDSQNLSRVRTWVLEGPQKDDGTVGWMLGNLLWWRLNATLLVAALPLVVGLTALIHTGEVLAVFVTYTLALAAGRWVMEVSPKYDVTENY